MGLAGAGIGLVGLGTAVNMYGSYEAGVANKRINDYNASVADMQATDAIARGEENAAEAGTKASELVGSQRAAYAAQGIDVNTGSAVDVQDATQQIADRDLKTIRLNAMREAWGYKAQAAGLRLAGKYAYQAGITGAVGSGLSGAGQVTGMAAQQKALAGNSAPKAG